MVTLETEDRLFSLLLEYSEAEVASEVTRQVLAERHDFDAYSLYRRLVPSNIGGVTRTA